MLKKITLSICSLILSLSAYGATTKTVGKKTTRHNRSPYRHQITPKPPVYPLPFFLNIPRTEQHILPDCFAHLEHLYFETNTQTFFTIGKKIKPTKGINLVEERGYLFKQYENHPPTNQVPVQVSGTTVFILEKQGTPDHFVHFFHFLEHLVGLWNFGGEKYREDVKRFVFAGNGIKNVEGWQGANQVNYHLVRALFPHAKIQTWKDFLEDYPNETLHFERVLTSDRAMEKYKKEPYYTARLLGGHFTHFTKPSLDHLASSVWEYCGAKRNPSHRKQITFVKREHSRRLTADCQQQLLSRIQALPQFLLKIVDLAALSFKEQVQLIANTDILLGVHGNGLSHALFLPEGGSLIEIFPPSSFRVEYRILTQARKLNYFGWMPPIGWLTDANAEKLGSYGEVWVEELETDVDAIMALLESLTT